MYTSVILFIFKDLPNIKTLEKYLQVEYHYPKCLEPTVMFQSLDSVFRFCIYTSGSKYGVYLFHTLYSLVSSSFIHYLQCLWNLPVTYHIKSEIFQLCHAVSLKFWILEHFRYWILLLLLLLLFCFILFCFSRQGLIILLWLAWNSLCRPGSPGIPPSSASWVLGFKLCAATPGLRKPVAGCGQWINFKYQPKTLVFDGNHAAPQTDARLRQSPCNPKATPAALT